MPDENQPKNNHKKRNKVMLITLGIFVIAGLIWFGYWLFYGRFHIYTEDAYVHGNQVMLTPQISSGVQVIFAEETDYVEKGQIVVQMDPAEYELALEKAKEDLGATVRRIVGYFTMAAEKEAELILREAELRQAELNLKHREGLVETGAVSVEEFEEHQTTVIVSMAQVAAARKSLQTAVALIQGTTIRTHPDVLERVTALKQAYLNLIYCNVLAPMSGYVAKRSVQVGDYVHAGDTMLQIVPLDFVWIEANYKETKLKRLRIGQSCKFTADMHGDGIEYHGKVVGFQPGSGNAFALLPPQNASGNWIKIVQRVPVRVSVEPDEIKRDPIFLGCSIKMSVDARDDSGKMLSYIPTEKPIYTTDIYQTQFTEMEEVMPLVEEIITKNSVILDE